MENSLSQLRQQIFHEPRTVKARPALIMYLRQLSDVASRLPQNKLRASEGHGIAMDMCGAIAFISSDDVAGEAWLSEKSEPLLYEILQLSGTLDADPDNLPVWNKLFATVARLPVRQDWDF